VAELRTHFHLFAYGTLRKGSGVAASMLRDAELVGTGSVGGVLYDIDGEYPALVLYGSAPVEGEVWRCPVELLPVLDSYEGVADGLFRRVGVNVPVDGEDVACWTYVAGTALNRKLIPARRIAAWAGGAGS
jgi:gamma-glutamylcyclotransferase (GGCT)/AIG2-like uncharacterized protein YtfP